MHGHIPAGVERLQPIDRLPATRQLSLTIGLPLRNGELLTNLLQQIYDPASTNYHRYLTPEQFAAQFGPTQQDYQAVIAFAKSNHLTVTGLHPNRTLVRVNGSVADIERTFHLNLRVYKHPTEARNFFAPDAEPALDLSVPVLGVRGLDDFVIPRPMNLNTNVFYQSANATANTAGSGPRGNFIGHDFRAAYAPGVTLDGTGQTVGVFELDGYYPGDIAEYERIAGLPNVPLTNVFVDNFLGNPGGNNIEVALDIDMVIAMAPGLSRVIVYEGSSSTATIDDILNRMATDNLARQLSSSWTYVPQVDPMREQIFQQFAMQGQSFFESSGDNGAWVGSISAPADEPYATVVGGTSLTTAAFGGAWVSETTWPGSGGGISTTYPIPIWQQGTSMAANQGSTTKRNIPDVACLADAVIWVVANNGQNGFTGGTSAATPLWAGFVALVNQQAAARGLPSVGFLNPAIYSIGGGSSYAAAFHDITTGNNFSSGSGTKFSATAGYDLCTGWGSPNGSNTINALLAPADAFQIAPAINFTASGPVGGPFLPVVNTYSLTASGSSVNWYLANVPPWLSASQTNGALTPGGGPTLLHLTVNSVAISLAAGSYSATLWFTNLNNGFAQSRTVTLDVITAPVITAQPTNLNLLAGATAVFTVGTATNAQLFYQWQQNNTNLVDGGSFFGSATPMLIISNVIPTDAASYSVIVSNALGTMTSSNALLTILSSKPVVAVPPAGQTVLPGSTVSFSVTALGDQTLFYQWQQNQTNLADGGNRSGSASSILTINGVTPADAGNYSVVVSNSLGSTNSAAAILNVIPVTASNTALMTLYSFTGGNDGANPNELMQLGNGVWYGTTQFGGAYSAGTVFQMSPGNVPANIYSFTGTNDGANSFAALAQGLDGNLYGTTFQGGAGDNGTVFNITTNGTLNTLVVFNSTNGDLPFDKLVRGADGSFYGTSYQGGASGRGSIFRLGTNGSFTTLYSFTGGGDGGFPHAALTAGADGSFYGTTFAAGNFNLGTVFKITTDGTFTSLLSFNNTNGANPYAGLVQGVDGYFYGVTANGGSQTNGVLFKMSASGVITNFYSFTGGSDGAHPSGSLIQAGDGNFYGTTASGGTYGNGTLFRLTPNFALSNFVEFDGYNGANPEAALTQGADGNLYGVTPNGGASGRGSIFRFSILSPPQITGQPANQQVFAGASATFSVAVFGSPTLTYQWKANGSILSDGVNVSGSTTANLTLNNVTTSNTAVYTVTIHNTLGSVTSTNVFLAVFVSPPQILTQPTNLTLSPGVTANFSVTATGDQPLYYQWQENGLNLTNGGTISGVTTPNLVISNATEANNGVYSVIVSNALGSVPSTNASLSVIPGSAPGTRLTGLHFFAGGADGSSPSRLTLGTDGNLYGTTRFGGAKHAGSVFRVSTNGTVTNLASFGATSGFGPLGGVVQGFGGNFYGTTQFGITNSSGNIFMMTPDGTLSNVYSFTGLQDGYAPAAPLVRGPDGNLYGSTQTGGNFASGNIFRLTMDGRVANIYSFTGGTDGGFPTNGLTVGVDGNFYGVTQFGGANRLGSVFKLTTNGVFSTVYSFTDGTDGEFPNDPLVQGPNGILYGNTRHSTLAGRQFYGVIFSVTTNGALSTLYILNAADGHYPAAGLMLANDGNFYGTGEFGGGTGKDNGTVFRITPNGTEATLVNFDGIDGGAHPQTPLTQGPDGNFYGTTSTGGPGGSGTIFRLAATAAPVITTQPAALTAFPGSTVSLSVGVFGSPTLTYQWKANSTNLTDGGNVSGSSSRTLTFTNVTTNNAGTYSVIISNALGSVTSTGALLSVTSALPTILSQPPATQTVLPGVTVTLGVTASGNVPLFYQWRYSGTNLTDAGNVAGSLTPNLTLNNVGPADVANYSVVVSNAQGAKTNSGTQLIVAPVTTPGNTLSKLYSLSGTDGGQPYGLVQGVNGVFYGVTRFGGTNFQGSLYQLTTNNTPVDLHSFSGGDGEFPQAPLIRGADGNFYGTTFGDSIALFGSVFKLTPDGVFTNLYSFTGGSDGALPSASLVQGMDGNFYGTASAAGDFGYGTIFQLTPDGALIGRFSFSGGVFGGQPSSALAPGSYESFYGTTAIGGASGGTVFRFFTIGVLADLVLFSSGADGAVPSGLVRGWDGNFYGATASGGAHTNGTVFKITPDGVLNTLHTFGSLTNSTNADGANPQAAFVLGTDGNFYGLTANGGVYGDGTVFQITPSGAFTTLAWFDGPNGAHPNAAMIQALDGNFYGTTPLGGINGVGSIFQLGVSLQPRFLTGVRMNGVFNFTWSAVTGRNYQVQFTTSLGATNWLALGGPIKATNGTVTVSAVAGTNSQRFFRVMLQ